MPRKKPSCKECGDESIVTTIDYSICMRCGHKVPVKKE